jgi:2-phospho-L-lactate guanylyltransferase (CobY/MobA/RfbA family)
MENESLIHSMLQKVLGAVEDVKNQISTIHVDQERMRGDFHARILEQVTATDTKLSSLERRIEDKITTRETKVDDWFDDMQETFSKYQIAMEARITAVTIKTGLIIGTGTLILSTVVGLLIRFLFATSSGQ